MRHLYLKIYLAILLSLLVFACLMAVTWWFNPDGNDERRHYIDGLATTIELALAAEPEHPQSVLKEIADAANVDLTLLDGNNQVVAATGTPIRIERPQRSGWLSHHVADGHAVALFLNDDRWLIANERHPRKRGMKFIAVLIILVLAIAVGAHPLARRLTQRLENLQLSVERLGAGDLTARVEVQGRDEVARLARSFNASAERIEQLVNDQKHLLAGASHELRSPLTRIRMALELLAGPDKQVLLTRVERDIASLDDLIDELLTASRLGHSDALIVPTGVDVLAVVAEEGAIVDADVEGSPVMIQSDLRLLRRALRNIYDNAHRHAAGAPINARVTPINGRGVRIVITDGGAGIDAQELERIFEPFYRPAGRKESDGRGYGLGLSLVRQIAERHGGQVYARSEESHSGTRFVIELFDIKPYQGQA